MQLQDNIISNQIETEDDIQHRKSFEHRKSMENKRTEERRKTLEMNHEDRVRSQSYVMDETIVDVNASEKRKSITSEHRLSAHKPEGEQEIKPVEVIRDEHGEIVDINDFAEE